MCQFKASSIIGNVSKNSLTIQKSIKMNLGNAPLEMCSLHKLHLKCIFLVKVPRYRPLGEEPRTLILKTRLHWILSGQVFCSLASCWHLGGVYIYILYLEIWCIFLTIKIDFFYLPFYRSPYTAIEWYLGYVTKKNKKWNIVY